MKVLAAWKTTDGKKEEVSQEIYEQDYPKLKRMHKKACKEVIWWDVFGGVLSIENRNYQVCEEGKNVKKS